MGRKPREMDPRRRRRYGPIPSDLSGKRFGRLVVESFDQIETSSSGMSTWNRWWCVCDCGTRKSIIQGALTSKKSDRTISCGCFHREDVAVYARDLAIGTPEERALRRVYTSYKHRAKKFVDEFGICFDEFFVLIKRDCYYCGAPPSNTTNFNGWFTANKDKKYGVFEKYNGLDRVDNSKGYTIDNVVPCCATCNRAKRSMSLDDFSSWVARVHQHMHRSWWDIDPIVSAA